MKYLSAILFTSLLFGCQSDNAKKNAAKIDQYSYELGVVGGFSELIAAGVKQLALSAPMSSKEMDTFIIDAQKVAEKHGVSVFRESDLIVTHLFPADVAKGKEVLLLYTGNTRTAYNQLKTDKVNLEKTATYTPEASMEIARRFGRLLSYSPKKINELLAQNTDFRTMADFGIKATNLFLYYKDLQAAGEFYVSTLGMELVADYGMALILRMTTDSYLILVDADKGMHTATEPKTVALALLTDQLKEWYDYLESKKVPIKYKYKEGAAHDGFVAIDPEGYLLEFERFNQHSENENFIPILQQNKTKSIPSNPKSTKPAALKIHSTITWLYNKDVLAMQQYYQDVLGLEMVADQGWTKIYQASTTGFMAIVDERRGMHSFTEKKAVNVGFILDDLLPWFDYVKANQLMELREEEINIGPETRYKSFVGYGPEGYYLEFDTFFPHDDNTLFLEYLGN